MKLIRITAVWCPACLIMRSRIDEVLNKYNIESIEYDYDIDDDIVEKYNVTDILPVFILEDNGKELIRIIGEKDTKYIEDKLKGCLE